MQPTQTNEKKVTFYLDPNWVGNDMEKRNWTILHGNTGEMAKDVWDLGKDCRLIHKGGGRRNITRIREGGERKKGSCRTVGWS